MRQFKILKYLLIASLFLTAVFIGLLLFINASRINLNNFSLLLFLIIALGPNLMHIYVSYSLARNYFPHKEVPRSFIIAFHIVSVFGWIVCIGLLLVIATLIFQLINGDQDLKNWHFLSFTALASLFLLACLMPFQFTAARKLLSVINENHKRNLLESFK